ncbi:MAG: folate-dependent phosphoribosylglycinamide formyltransferase PurN [Flavobacteriales bacterium]
MIQPVDVVLLCSDTNSTRAVHAALREQFASFAVIQEQKVPRKTFLERRVKQLGKRVVAGQLAFMGLAVRSLMKRSAPRIAELRQTHGLSAEPVAGPHVLHVSSVNAEEAREHLKALAPKLVIINGTRIIGRKTLACSEAPFINMHAGITPLYRGVHGGYWAMAERKPELFGSTIHYVDRGIDTGSIIEQVFCRPTPIDTFVTYPFVQTGNALPRLLALAETIVSGAEPPAPTSHDLPSVLRTHPTLSQYVYNRARFGVR